MLTSKSRGAKASPIRRHWVEIFALLIWTRLKMSRKKYNERLKSTFSEIFYTLQLHHHYKYKFHIDLNLETFGIFLRNSFMQLVRFPSTVYRINQFH